ncbi:MAG: glycosyltransferase, partial [Vicingaceae bacterium]
NKKFAWLKSHSKTKEIIKVSKTIITGNNYLAKYAQQYCNDVVVIPTTIDTDYHHKTGLKNNNKITIGWTGSSSTLPYFESIIPELKKLKSKYSNQIQFQVIVDENKYYPEIDTQTTLWNIENEISDLAKVDIGLMPLPDTEWAKGKCGFKALQYMSLGVPPIVSAIGVNTEIVINNKNGLLIYNNSEWVLKIEELIKNTVLRKQLGEEARKTIVAQYSITANKEKYLAVFNSF